MRRPSRSTIALRGFLPWPGAEDGRDGRVEADHGSLRRLLLDGHQQRVALLTTVVHHDVDSRVVLPRRTSPQAPARPPSASSAPDTSVTSSPPPPSSRSSTSAATSSRSSPTTAKSPSIDAEHVAGLARPGHRHRLPGGDRDRAVAGVPGGRGHLQDVLVEACGRARGRRARPVPAPAPGSGSPRPGCSWSASAVRAAIWATRTESWSLGSTTTSAAPHACDRLEQLPGRGPVARAAVDHDRAGLLEQRRQPGAGGHRDDAAAGPGCGGSAGCRPLLDLLGEVGDPDPVRTAGGDAGLDRGADVVDVDVDVPQALAADHDQRVAERRRAPCGACGIASSSASSRYITSYDGPPAARSPPVAVGIGSGMRCGAGATGARAPAGQRGLGGVEDHAEPAAAGVDHPGVAQHLQLLGRAGERLARGGRAR